MSVSAPSSPIVVRPARTVAKLERQGEQLQLSYVRRQWGKGLSLTAWLTGWTVGNIWLTSRVIADPTLFNILLPLPFWAIWLFYFSKMVNAFAQNEDLVLDSGGVAYSRRAILPIQVRTVPLAEIVDFGPCHRAVNSERTGTEGGIELRTLGKPLQMAFGLDPTELIWLRHELNEHLGLLRNAAHARPGTELTNKAAAASPGAGSPGQLPGEVLSCGDEPLAPPSDCSWQRIEDFDSSAFVQRGRLDRWALGKLLYINVFWNGGISLLAAAGLFGAGPGGLAGIGWWAGALLLLPFAAVGLFMFALLVMEALEPFRTLTWRFNDAEVERRLAWFGLGRSSFYPIVRVERIELCRVTSRGKRKPLSPDWWRQMLQSDEDSFGLLLVAPDQSELCRIEGLTAGEARYIGDALLRECRAWFR